MKNIKNRTSCLVYSRVTGYLTPTANWNDAKLAEFKDRKTFKIKTTK
jgi:anaerobic ribonucleoside-triphosphate reductase